MAPGLIRGSALIVVRRKQSSRPASVLLGQLFLFSVVAAFWAPAAGAGNVIRDRVSGCGTSNPFPSDGESIRWYGACQDGLLSGHGTLIWYQNGQETQRNEGTFWAGEMHGPITTTYPDRTQLIGTYQAGMRNGQFMTFRTDGSHTVSIFDRGQLISERQVGASLQSPAFQSPRQTGTAGTAGSSYSRTAASAPNPQRGFARTAARSSLAQNDGWPTNSRIDIGMTDDTVVISGSGIENNYSGAFIGSNAYQVANAGRADAPRYRYGNGRFQAPLPAMATAPAAVGTDTGAADKLTPRNAPPVATPVAAPQPAMQIAQTGNFSNPAPAAPPAAAPSEGSAYRSAPPATPQARIATPEQRFVAALSAEQAGQTEQALASYSALAAQYPQSQVAQLAGERMARLTQAAATPQRIDPRSAAEKAAAATRMSERDTSPLFSRNAEIGSYVCSLQGLFGGQSKWCGIVRDSNAAYHFVEVTRVKADGFFNIGFTRAPCTGNTFINYFSRGIRVTVPKNCMGPVW